ncbi:hypothetical protein [Phenylobacterium sp.]|nr:hypothetical protein [Phenylobacterium sp.]MDP1875218.1 hypothetical protein [Phenylobacterium sp.]
MSKSFLFAGAAAGLALAAALRDHQRHGVAAARQPGAGRYGHHLG